MNIDDVKKICVVGAGNMGHQISLQCALSGYKTVCTDISEEQINKASSFVEKYLPQRVAKGRLTQEQADQAKANISFTTSLEEATRDVDFVIEAAIEKINIKRALFKQLDELCPPHAILATNSSYIVSSKVADATSRPAKVCNMHFFNPALVMKCVEVVKGPHTSDETAEITMELSKRLQKVPVLLHKEVYGFLVNRIIQLIGGEALFLLETGVASMEDIDSAVVNALGHPMGPFRLMDLTGIDLSYHVRMERYIESMDPAKKPSPTIVEKYVKGEWGQKVGKGFYSYDK
ncbi:MAG: 3-hydroxyacyl-CoA dehydrogenase family protein [Dethiobacter sp.]|jgi:3-hydroxybutyryl-CoA dehydrogenase|nr:3-hydroxyacyl-CoA dehydrogenase family protein [Dethiobacter sp.]